MENHDEHETHMKEMLLRIFARAHIGAAADSPTPHFIFLGLNWLIVKFILEQIYFVPEQFFSCSSNTKNLFGNKFFLFRNKK